MPLFILLFYQATSSTPQTRPVLKPANTIHTETLKPAAISEEVNLTKIMENVNYISPQLQIATKSIFPHAEVDALFGLI